MFQDVYNEKLYLNIFIPLAEISVMIGYLNCFNWRFLPLTPKYRSFILYTYTMQNQCRK